MKLGVITDCFKTNAENAIIKSSELGLMGVQIYATTGEFSPEVLTEAEIEKYKKLLSDNGLTVSALCADMGGFGFEIEKDNPERIEKTNRIADLARKLGSNVITTHIGVIPEDRSSEKYKVMLSALRACGDYAKSIGVTLAIETGPEIAKTLKAFVEDAGDGVGVNLDPANFVMVTGQNPAEAVRLLGKKIVHTHVKDGRKLKECSALEVYHSFALGGIEALNVSDLFIETPVGEGDVDWNDYLSALSEVGYDGFLTIERETGLNPEADIILARDFIISKLKEK